MAVTFYGKALFGIQHPKPLKGFPKGKTKIRMRDDDWVSIFVRTDKGIFWFYAEEQDGYWMPYCEVGRNLTA